MRAGQRAISSTVSWPTASDLGLSPIFSFCSFVIGASRYRGSDFVEPRSSVPLRRGLCNLRRADMEMQQGPKPSSGHFSSRHSGQ